MIGRVEAVIDVAAIITSFTGLVTLLIAYKIHKEVKTVNGKTIAVLTDLTEARRIKDEIAPEDRTESEDHYVDLLEDEGDDMT